jgi:hypothetical protein
MLPADSLLGRLATAARPSRPWLHVTAPPWLARILIAGGAQSAPPADAMQIHFPRSQAEPAVADHAPQSAALETPPAVERPAYLSDPPGLSAHLHITTTRPGDGRPPGRPAFRPGAKQSVVRSRTTRVRRGASQRRDRSVRARQRTTSRRPQARRQRARTSRRPAIRRARYSRSRAPQLRYGKALLAVGVAAVALTTASYVVTSRSFAGQKATDVLGAIGHFLTGPAAMLTGLGIALAAVALWLYKRLKRGRSGSSSKAPHQQLPSDLTGRRHVRLAKREVEQTGGSVTHVPTGYTGPEEPRQYWEPALTLREAVRVGISSHEYEAAALFARMAVEEQQRAGTPRDRWEPMPLQNDQLAGPFIADGEQELASQLEAEVDPALEEAQDLMENAKASFDEAVEDTLPIAAPEAGVNYSVAEAVMRVEQDDRKIEQDKAVGKRHHDRASVPLMRLATSAPWLEAVGFLTFVSYYLNVPLLRPWQDWLGWSFAATVVVVIILGQTWLVRHAAQNHNHAREARADGQRQEAARAFTWRNRYIGLTAVTAAAVTSGLIWRGVAALGNVTAGTAVVMVFFAVVTGLLLPTLAYLGVAVDGSMVSRERDGLAADLDADLDAYLAIISNCRRDLASVAEISDRLTDKTFPDICNTTQEAVDAIYSFYGTVRLLIGGLSADPPPKTPETIGRDAEGNIHGYIGTSIPGARKVNLKPLFDRWNRLTEIEKQRKRLLDRIEALPPHPWGRSRAD